MEHMIREKYNYKRRNVILSHEFLPMLVTLLFNDQSSLLTKLRDHAPYFVEQGSSTLLEFHTLSLIKCAEVATQADL